MFGNKDNGKCKDGKCPANDKIGPRHTKALRFEDRDGKKTDCSAKGADGFRKKGK
jgi:hypothetical protein